MKSSLYLYGLYITKVADFGWKNAHVSGTQRVCLYDIYVFLIFFRCITVPNFITVGYVWQILRSRTFLDHPSVSPEKARPEKLKNNYFLPHLSSGKSLELMWKFDLFKNSKMCILYKQSFQWWNFFFDKFEQQMFLALTVNCKGQQNCLHTMGCNSNCGVFNAKTLPSKDLLRALPKDSSCYESQLVTSSAMPKAQVVDESKVHIQSRIFPWKPIFPKHLYELFTISN